jgi:choline dehydrogenase-like flavoprotein
MIVQGHEMTGPRSLRTHTLVVGSGSGGGVAAYHLAEAGVDTIVVEEGGYHVASEFNQREEDMYPMLYRSGGQQMTSDGMISVMQGSCYGGGTVINVSDAFDIPSEVLAHWRHAYGTTEWNEKSLEASFARVHRHLNVKRINKSLVNRNNGLLLETAQKLGWSAEVMHSNRKGCVGSGYCLLGCAYDARLGTNLTYLPWALEKGADVYTDVRCDRLERIDGSRWRAHCTVVQRGLRAARFPLTITCERVVLAASAIFTPAILLRSGLGDGLPQLGKNLTLQPQLGMIGRFDESEEIVHWRGAPQSVEVNEFADNSLEHGLGGFRLEGIGGVIGPVMIMAPGFGREHKRFGKSMRNLSTTLLLVPDQPSGAVSYQWTEDGRVTPKIDYVMQEEWKQRLKAGMRRAAELLFAAGAREVAFANQAFPPLESPDDLGRIAEFRIEPGWTTFNSAHNQGTCRMGTSPTNSVVDQNLKVHGLDDVYVMDGSIMPTSASTHTMIPIMAAADFAVHRMLQS